MAVDVWTFTNSNHVHVFIVESTFSILARAQHEEDGVEPLFSLKVILLDVDLYKCEVVCVLYYVPKPLRISVERLVVRYLKACPII